MNAELYELYSEFLTWFGDLYYATKPPLCKAEQIKKMLEVIHAGDVICRGYHYYLDSVFIPGDYTHSGIVISKDKMAHSIAEGVQYIDPIDFIKDTDQFIVLRPKYLGDTKPVINRATWHVENKTQYDFTFKEDGRFYCHEFTSDCLLQGGILVSKTIKKFGVWIFSFTRELFLAQNLIDVCDVVYEFTGGEEND